MKTIICLLPVFVFLMLPLSLAFAEDLKPGTALDEAAAALKARDLPKASAMLEPLTRPESKDAAAFHLLSQVRLAEKNAQAAAEFAEKATQLDPKKAAYFSQLGVALGNRMGELSFMQQAVMSVKLKAAFAKAVELDPNDIGGLLGLARFYTAAPAIAGGSLDKAREYATRVRKLHPFLGELEFANIEAEDENFAGALDHFDAAAKLNPGNAHVQTQAARMLVKLGRKEEARARFEAALAIDGGSQAAKKGLAELAGSAP